MNKVGLPSAPFRLSSEDIKTANSHACSVSLPSFDFTPGPIFTRIFGLKSHDWKGVMNHCVRVLMKACTSTRGNVVAIGRVTVYLYIELLLLDKGVARERENIQQ